MSGLVDKWTEEVAKLREKGQAVFSTARTSLEAARGSLWWQTGLVAQAMRFKKLAGFNCSEASISVLVDIFSA